MKLMSHDKSNQFNLVFTCIFHVLGRCIVDLCPFACFVCCIIWLIKSNCWRVNPSLLVPAGDDGDGDFELIAVIVFPSAFIWYWIQVAPCGELASPNVNFFRLKKVKSFCMNFLCSTSKLDIIHKIKKKVTTVDEKRKKKLREFTACCCGW